MDEIKIQELIGSLQTYELGLPSHKSSKSLALKTITERIGNSFEEDDVEKEVVFLVKNFQNFLKMNNSEKPFNKGNFSSPKGDRKEFRKKDGKQSPSIQGITCFKCNAHGHVKRECPNYLRMKGKAYATTLNDSDSSNSDFEDSCDEEGNFSAYMTIAHVESSEDLNLLMQELREHSDEESMGILEESDAKEDKKIGRASCRERV